MSTFLGIFVIIATIIWSNSVSATDMGRFDCALVPMFMNNDLGLAADPARFSAIETIYPFTDIEIAMDHLARYCCVNDLLPSKPGPNTPFVCPGNAAGDGLYADSPYLYDQLIDIGMRRLAGSKDEQYPNGGLDELAQSRRSTIGSLSINPQGTPPGLILLQYNNHRKPEQVNAVVNNAGNEYYQKNRADRGLVNRHRSLCGVSANIVDMFADYGKGRAQPNTVATRACMTMVEKFLTKEYQYVQMVMSKQSASLLATNTKIYADASFTQTKLQTLLDTFSRVQSTFGLINQKVIKGTKMCSGG